MSNASRRTSAVYRDVVRHQDLSGVAVVGEFGAVIHRPDDIGVSSSAALMAKNYWLMKSGPDECSIDDVLASPRQTVPWTGVRNYQARNFMRDAMLPGDGVLFYHSSCAQPGIAGIARVASRAYPDATQFDRRSKYFDAAATAEQPRWVHVDVQGLRKVELIPLAALRARPELADLAILRRGNRLSITPVTVGQWKFITTVLAGPAHAATRGNYWT